MKLFRIVPSLVVGLAALVAVLAWAAHAAEASGNVSPCDDAHLTTALTGGGLVTFSCGGPATITAAAGYTINGDTTIDGSNGGHPLTLTAASGVRLFLVASNTTLTLTNLTIAGVNASQGAILANGPLVINNVKFISNANYGVESNSPVTVTNSLFSANSGTAALFVNQYGRLNVASSQFISNTGYALWTEGPASVSNSQFDSNSTTGAGAGAGIFEDASALSTPLTLTVTSSQFMTNTAYDGGGGIYANGGVVTISSSQFISNSSTNYGGGGLAYQSLRAGDGLQVLSSTFQRNNNGAMAINGSGGYPFLLANSTIQDNLGPATTAGVSSGGMTLTVSQTSFINNHSSSNNPGALTAGGPASISGSTFYNNSGQHAGAAVLTNGGEPTFTDTVASSYILSNTSLTYEGGGIKALVPLIVADSVFSDNVAAGNDGGGLYWFDPGANLSISRSLFYHNSAPNSLSHGGGLFVQGHVTIANSTIYSNSAVNTGGIHLSNSSSLTLTNDTIASNTATALFTTGNLFGGSLTPVAMVNTILAGGSPKNCGGSIVSLGHNLSNDSTCPLTATGDLSGTSPLLGPFQDNGGPSWTLMPTAVSPAVNSGDNANCPSPDQRGVARPIGAACDMGAVETPYKTPQTISFGPLPMLSLRAAPFHVSGSATSGLPVTFSSLTPSVCTVSGTLVTLVAGGTCIVEAAQAGNAIYAAAPNVDQSFEVLSKFLFLPEIMK